MKKQINEVKRLQKIAGILKEDMGDDSANPTQRKFKVGDRVKCLVDRGVARVGYTGTIESVKDYESDFPYIVKWDGMDLRSVRGTLDFKEDDLELLQK